MIDVRLPAISAALLVASLSPIQADQARPAVSQECAASQACHAPGVNDMMVATQLRHFKLWYAGLVQNWRLASYELTQIRASIEETKAIYKKSGPSSKSRSCLRRQPRRRGRRTTLLAGGAAAVEFRLG